MDSLSLTVDVGALFPEFFHLNDQQVAVSRTFNKIKLYIDLFSVENS